MKYYTLKRYLPFVFLTISALPGVISAEVITTEDKQTGLQTWEWKQAGISLKLIQRLPDQTRAFFLARGFTRADANTIGEACVFQTIFRNDGKESLSYDLNEWDIVHRGKMLTVQTRERWENKWLAKNVGKSARIAFHWSLLPTRQSFEPSDYNWGMTSFGLAPGESFDLSFVLNVNNTVVKDRISEIVCSSDQL